MHSQCTCLPSSSCIRPCSSLLELFSRAQERPCSLLNKIHDRTEADWAFEEQGQFMRHKKFPSQPCFFFCTCFPYAFTRATKKSLLTSLFVPVWSLLPLGKHEPSAPEWVGWAAGVTGQPVCHLRSFWSAMTRGYRLHLPMKEESFGASYKLLQSTRSEEERSPTAGASSYRYSLFQIAALYCSSVLFCSFVWPSSLGAVILMKRLFLR